MGGLLVLVLAGLYLWIVFVAVRKVPKAWGKALALLVAVSIPTADAVYGRIKLKHLCETEGGMKIFRMVEGVEGFYRGDFRPDPEWITKHGYSYVEGQDLDGKPMRLSKGSDGQLVEEKKVALKSQYQFVHSGRTLGSGFVIDEYIIADKAANMILARNQNIGFVGGWVERAIGSVSGARSSSAGSCQEGVARVSPAEIVSKTLLVSKK